MSLETLLATYGYPAVVLGTFLEGETVLIIAGFLVHRGYMGLAWVIVAAFIGSLLGDQFAFYLGRRHGQAVLSRKPEWRQRMDHVNALTERYRSGIILAFRFLYGLRNIIPFTLGMGDIPAGRFLALNAAGAIVWAAALGSGGYLFGKAMEALLGDLRRYEIKLLAALAVLGLLLWAARHLRTRRICRRDPDDPTCRGPH